MAGCGLTPNRMFPVPADARRGDRDMAAGENAGRCLRRVCRLAPDDGQCPKRDGSAEKPDAAPGGYVNAERCLKKCYLYGRNPMTTIYDFTQTPFRLRAGRHEAVQTRATDLKGPARAEKIIAV